MAVLQKRVGRCTGIRSWCQSDPMVLASFGAGGHSAWWCRTARISRRGNVRAAVSGIFDRIFCLS